MVMAQGELLVLLYKCPHTAIYVSSHYYVPSYWYMWSSQTQMGGAPWIFQSFSELSSATSYRFDKSVVKKVSKQRHKQSSKGSRKESSNETSKEKVDAHLVVLRRDIRRNRSMRTHRCRLYVERLAFSVSQSCIFGNIVSL